MSIECLPIPPSVGKGPLPEIERYTVPLRDTAPAFHPFTEIIRPFNEISGTDLAALREKNWGSRAQEKVPEVSDISPYFNPEIPRTYVILTVRDLHYQGKDPAENDPRMDLIITEQNTDKPEYKLLTIYDYSGNTRYYPKEGKNQICYLRVLGVILVNNSNHTAASLLPENMFAGKTHIGLARMTDDLQSLPAGRNIFVTDNTQYPDYNLSIGDALYVIENWQAQVMRDLYIKKREQDWADATWQAESGEKAARELRKLPIGAIIKDLLTGGSRFARLTEIVIITARKMDKVVPGSGRLLMDMLHGLESFARGEE